MTYLQVHISQELVQFTQIVTELIHVPTLLCKIQNSGPVANASVSQLISHFKVKQKYATSKATINNMVIQQRMISNLAAVLDTAEDRVRERSCLRQG